LIFDLRIEIVTHAFLLFWSSRTFFEWSLILDGWLGQALDCWSTDARSFGPGKCYWHHICYLIVNRREDTLILLIWAQFDRAFLRVRVTEFQRSCPSLFSYGLLPWWLWL
jgi:hypothetical protein